MDMKRMKKGEFSGKEWVGCCFTANISQPFPKDICPIFEKYNANYS
jgi:hypothetical protein